MHSSSTTAVYLATSAVCSASVLTLYAKTTAAQRKDTSQALSLRTGYDGWMDGSVCLTPVLLLKLKWVYLMINSLITWLCVKKQVQHVGAQYRFWFYINMIRMCDMIEDVS